MKYIWPLPGKLICPQGLCSSVEVQVNVRWEIICLLGTSVGSLTERYSGAAVPLLFGLIQKEAKRSRTSNRPARQASAPPWMFGPTHVGK
jgi:hypothetical protein